MIVGYSPEVQAIFGTLFTWGLTAAGSALVFFMSGTQVTIFSQVSKLDHQFNFSFILMKRKFLDSSLGFAAGVMLAASYWSLLAPAIEMAESSGMYGESGEYAFAPVALGFFMGALFVFAADQLMHYFKIGSTELMMGILFRKKNLFSVVFNFVFLIAFIVDLNIDYNSSPEMKQKHIKNNSGPKILSKSYKDGLIKRKAQLPTGDEEELRLGLSDEDYSKLHKQSDEKWKRILLLVIAITVHNIPG